MSASWRSFEEEAPDFARYVRGRIEQHGLGLLATIAADGAPRISGIEPVFSGGHLWFGMMPGSVKGRDLRRDGRFALHNATTDKEVTEGDVKIHGVATLVDDRGAPGIPDVGAEADLFRADLTRVASIRVATDHLVIEVWRPGRAVERQDRY